MWVYLRTQPFSISNSQLEILEVHRHITRIFLIERRMKMGNVNIKREEEFIIIPKWMREELDLRGNELLIYALIFDRSSAGKC